MQNNHFLLYGANGYTGQIIAQMAHEYQLKPILAGRKESTIRPLADSLGLPYRIFDLNEKDKLQAALQEVKVVLHAAGPFQHTAKKMMEACIATQTHYLDITGEITVFELAKSFDIKAKEAGIMIMSGVGFDVVPTDCTALFIKNHLPDATHLKLAFAMLGGMLSHGTATTMAENAGEPGVVRENGKIVRKPLGHKGFWVDFGIKKLFVMCIPWGDISTAFTTTGIPNIETYAGTSPKTFSMLKWQALFNWFLRLSFVKKQQLKKIKQKPAGPTEEMRKKGRSLVWGEGTNAAGEKCTVRLNCPEGYQLTALSSLLIIGKVLSGNITAGYQTPAGVYGADLILEIPTVTRELV
jgi:short subunit dehydrogenase-like uncharacterized protein